MKIEISIGEIVDKLSILQIKKNNMKKTFITFAYGETHLKLCELLQKSIREFSNYSLLIYKINDFDFVDDDLKKDVSFLYKFKILSCLKSLEIYDEVIWLDTDIIVTNYIDNVWNESFKLKNYPLLPIHSSYNFTNTSINYIDYKDSKYLEKGKKKIGLVDNDFQNQYLQACCMFFNKKSISFFNEVLEFYKDFDSTIFPYGDETIINLLFWKKKITQSLDYNFLCSWFTPDIIINQIISFKDDINFYHKCSPLYVNDALCKWNINLNPKFIFLHGNKSFDVHNNFLKSLIINRITKKN
jgi:hypothetical protein